MLLTLLGDLQRNSLRIASSLNGSCGGAENMPLLRLPEGSCQLYWQCSQPAKSLTPVIGIIPACRRSKRTSACFLLQKRRQTCLFPLAWSLPGQFPWTIQPVSSSAEGAGIPASSGTAALLRPFLSPGLPPTRGVVFSGLLQNPTAPDRSERGNICHVLTL